MRGGGELTVVQNDHFLLETEPELQALHGLEIGGAQLPGPAPASGVIHRPTWCRRHQSSRRHAEIELRGDKFMLIDRSSNGTFVQIEGEREFLLSREGSRAARPRSVCPRPQLRQQPQIVSFVCIPGAGGSPPPTQGQRPGAHRPARQFDCLPDCRKNFPSVRAVEPCPANSCMVTGTPADSRLQHRPCIIRRSAGRNRP